MTVLVTGAAGQLGQDLMDELRRRGMHAVGIDREQADITDYEQVRAIIAKTRPDAVVHCAAYTAVDKAETDRERCYAINVTGTENVARACASVGAAMVYISTDYVLPGDGDDFQKPDAEKHPLNYYGQTKSLGEDAAARYTDKLFIVRTSWVFGARGQNFVKTMARLGAERDTLSVVADQIGSPTYTRDLARLLADMIATDRYGVYHATGEGVCSWYEFACAIMETFGLACDVRPVTTAEYPTAAKRPLNSRLSKDCLDQNGFARLPDWRDALARYAAEIRALS
ncbi:MAG: dTDP-4-dehydrorhamnose reductase [Clostridia bacterium]|nr:dTDP-4-dehydrorhamnose reductase [Clostridia bacterium]